MTQLVSQNSGEFVVVLREPLELIREHHASRGQRERVRADRTAAFASMAKVCPSCYRNPGSPRVDVARSARKKRRWGGDPAKIGIGSPL
jgi:hypothetical protein